MYVRGEEEWEGGRDGRSPKLGKEPGTIRAREFASVSLSPCLSVGTLNTDLVFATTSLFLRGGWGEDWNTENRSLRADTCATSS